MRLPAADSRPRPARPARRGSSARDRRPATPDSTLWCGLPPTNTRLRGAPPVTPTCGLARLPGAVDVATDDRHVERLAHVLEAALELVHRRDHVEVLARAARAGHEVDALGAQAHAFQDVPADLHFLDRIGRERDADGVADAVHQQHAETDRGLHGARAQAPGLGDAEMQRLLDLRGELAVGLDRHEDVGGLQADLEVRGNRAGPGCRCGAAPTRPSRRRQGSGYLRCSSFSSEPALTPMRIGMPLSRAAAITARTRSSRPMLPGLMRRQSTPVFATASAIR